MVHARSLLVLVAVGLAFADASIVALALPDLYGELDVSIVAVSWVLTIYAATVAVVAPLAHLATRRLPPAALVAGGAAVFAAGSLASGLAGSLELLLAARVVQAAGAAALLAGSPSVLRRLGSGPAAWTLAGTVGAAAGPALGGVVTQLADWRMVFVLQVPVALLALLAVVAGPLPGPAVVGSPDDRLGARRPAWLADAALGLVFASLTGVLFLAVLLLVVVWGHEPIRAALVVLAVPVGAALARPAGHDSSPAVRAVVGPLLLAGGLATLALLPGISDAWVAGALFAAGLGLGIVSQLLGPVAVPPHSGPGSAARSTSARHLGFVLGLAVIAPVVSAGVEGSVDRAAQAAVGTVLDARLPAPQKVGLAIDLQRAVDGTPRGQVPDLEAAVRPELLADDRVTGVLDDLDDRVAAIVTRGFRPAFAVAAGFALLAAVPALLAVRAAGLPAPASTARSTRRFALAGAGAVALVLPLAALPAGATTFGGWQPADPCVARPDPYPGGSLGDLSQRLVLSGLNGAACELGTSREQLLIDLDEGRLRGPAAEDALRSGLRRAVQDSEDRGSLPGWAASALEWAVDRAPVDWFLDRLGID
jgi:MFS family permease